MPWHKDSDFPHPAHFIALTREDRARWRFLADTARRHQRLSAAQHDVALALLAHHAADTGRCDPGHARLAQLARCCIRTVRSALHRLQGLRLVQWTRRLVRTPSGSRQTSNAYRLFTAALDTVARRPGPGCKACRGTKTSYSSKSGALSVEAQIAAALAWQRDEEARYAGSKV